MILVLPLNPDGFMIITNMSSASGYLINAQYVSEWQPLVITNRLSWPFFGLLALWMLGLAFTGEKTPLQELALMFIFTYLSLRYLRMPPYFYIIAAPIVAERLSRIEWDQIITKFERILNLGSTHKPPAGNPINGVILIIFFLVALISLPPVRLALTHQPSTALISRNFPVDAVNALTEQPSRIYSLSEWGGFLIWRYAPQASVFVDGRIALYPLPVWEDYLTIALAGPGWEELLDRYKVDTLVLSKDRQGAIIAAAMQAGWRDMSEDKASVILMRP